MATNINFSFKRLAAVVKRDLVENWKKNFYKAVGCYCGLAAGFLTLLISRSGMYCSSNEIAYDRLCDSAHTFLMIFICIYMLVSASSILEITNTKEKRISYMMLPATKGEKFLNRVLHSIVVSFLIFIVSLIMAELTRMALTPLFNVPDSFSRFCLADVFTADRYEPMLRDSIFPTSVILLLSYILWVHSIYILGGSYFRKRPFVKTVGICFAVSFLIGFFSVSIVENTDSQYIFKWINEFADNHTWMKDFDVMMGILSFILLAFTAIHWTISYRLFTKMQITERKLFRL